MNFERNRQNLTQDANKRQNSDPSKEPRVISAINRSSKAQKRSFLSLKLVKKIPKNERSKKSLDRLYEVLAPGSSIIKSDKHSSIIKEPAERQITIRNIDLAKFGTKDEGQTDLKDYADRRPQAPTVKTTEEMVTKHAGDAR